MRTSSFCLATHRLAPACYVILRAKISYRLLAACIRIDTHSLRMSTGTKTGTESRVLMRRLVRHLGSERRFQFCPISITVSRCSWPLPTESLRHHSSAQSHAKAPSADGCNSGNHE